jgi:hypothetical protein
MPPIQVNLPEVDWSKLIPQLIGLFFSGIGTYFTDVLHDAFDGLWGSGANVLGQTDLAMTWGFGPIHDQVLSVQTGARAVLLFALVLLGLKGMLGGIISHQASIVADFVNGVLMAVILVAAFPLVIPQVIGLTNQAATAVGTADLSAYLSAGTATNPIVQLILFVILLFFAIRLLMKAAWRIGFLAVLLPVGMAACALYAMPQTRWILGWWARMWGGMLIAQLPSVMALTIGAQLFAHGSGLGAFVYSIAFLQLATDLYSLIPFGHTGGSGGAPWGALPLRPMIGAATGGAGGAAAAAIPAAQVTTMADRYGYQ